MKNNGKRIAGAAVIGGVLGLACWWWDASSQWAALTAPLLLAGKGLRALALSGWAGNLAAWGVTGLVCALPLALPAWRGRRGWTRGGEDWLPALMVPVLFALVYCLVNPTLLGEPAAALFPLAALGTLLSLGLAWPALKLLRGMEGTPAEGLAALFRPLLTACALLLALGAAWGRTAELLAQWDGVREGNSALTGPVRLTMAVLVVLALLKLLPDLLAALALLWGVELAGTLGRMVFDEEAVELCGRTAEGCRLAARATVVLTIAANLLQLILLGWLRRSHFSVSLPLFSLALSAGLYLLCRCLQRGRELQEDSDSII